jgi:hypothetical protein
MQGYFFVVTWGSKAIFKLMGCVGVLFFLRRTGLRTWRFGRGFGLLISCTGSVVAVVAALHSTPACAHHVQSGFFFGITWGSGILLAGHTRFHWANPTAGSLRRCLTSETRHTPNTRRCPAPGPKKARELNPYTCAKRLCWQHCSGWLHWFRD